MADSYDATSSNIATIPLVSSFDRYMSLMPQLSKNQISIEKSPSYMLKEDAPRRLYWIHPTVKIIAILRNPVDRLLSDYMQVGIFTICHALQRYLI